MKRIAVLGVLAVIGGLLWTASIGPASGFAAPVASTTAGGVLVPLAPARLLDTRAGIGAAGPVAAGGTVHLQVDGRGGVPASGVGAVVLNVTVTQPKVAGVVTVWPEGAARPATSNLNFVAGQTVPNLVVARVGTAGKVDLLNASGGTIQLVGDVSGYFTSGPPAAGGLGVLSPARLLDTRAGIGAAGPVAAGGTVHLQVDGRGGVPASGVGAVVLNVTVTQPKVAGVVTVWPEGAARPATSNLNFVAGQTVPNLVVARVGTAGKVDLLNASGGTIQLVGDVSGYFTSGPPAAGGLGVLSPARLLDTRAGIGAAGPVAAGGTVHLQVDGRGGVPASGVGAVVLNVTVTQPKVAGVVTVWPEGAARPATSNLNFVAGQTVPNLVVARVGTAGKVDLLNASGGTIQLVGDVSGYFTSVPPPGYPVTGIDVSAYQGQVDWVSVAAAGAKFAYVRASEQSNIPDAYFAANYQGAKADGLYVGAYHRARPDLSSGTAQADFFLDTAKYVNDGRTLPPMLDIEWPRADWTGLNACYNLSPAQLSAWIRDFVTEVAKRTGRQAVIYTNTNWWGPCTNNDATFGSNPLFIAGYTTSPPPLPASWATWTFWQYSDSGTLPGDQDVFNGDDAALSQLAGLPALTLVAHVNGG